MAITLWPAAEKLAGEQLATLGVELAHHVVEQHQRRAPRSRGEHGALGQQQREQGEPLLSLGAVDAQLAPVAQDRELVAVGAVAGEAALAGRRPGAPAARRRTRPRRRPASEGGSPASRSPLQPELARALRRTARRSSATAARAMARAAAAPGGRARGPSVDSVAREARPERMRAEQGVALREHPRVLACGRPRAPARARRRPGRDARGGAPGAPLSSSRRSGMNTLISGRCVDVEQPLDGCAVAAHALRRALAASAP